ncbi:hypothetical protein HY379_01575 [Candidatus Saccharibacteria bacterium]|nr:hypothetical protein [Candidatus Saccharibacteria bacterium]
MGLFFGALVFLFFYYFALVFPFDSKVNSNRQAIYSAPLVAIALLSLTSLTVPSVKIEDFGAQPQDIGLIYTLSDVVGILYLLAGTIILLVKYKRSGIREKNQIRLILVGLSIAAVANIFTGLVLTLLNVETTAILFGSFSLFIFSLFVAYAIVQHGFFDIRSVVARSAAYVLSLGTVGSLTLLLVYIVSVVAEQNNLSKGAQQFFNALFVVSLALVYQPLKKFFDKATNQIFYRDAYESEELLNELNKSLVTTIDLDEILQRSAAIISDKLKAEYSVFVIRGGTEHSWRVVGRSGLGNDVVKAIISGTSHIKDKVIIYDDLEPTRRHVKEMMAKNKITALVKLEGRVAGHSQHPGYILLGQKRSGGLYSMQDVQILEIISDELVIAIQNALRFEEIQRFNITLQQKIEEATRELRRVNVRLRELDKTKDEFISMASHQLRTPLTAVKGYLSMVLEGDTGAVKKSQKEMINRAFSGAQKMVYLIADMLNVSRLQTGKFVIENQPTNLADLIEGEVSQLQETADSRQLKLIYHKPAKFPMLNLDETKIRQVVMNFLDNAIYYTPSGGSITADLTASEEEIRFTVNDTGLGVPAAVQHHLFSKFYRANNARKMRPDGTGLGLFMAKKVITVQGGAIIFKSKEGEGSTFGFSFPRHSMEVKGGKLTDKSAPQHEVVLSKK